MLSRPTFLAQVFLFWLLKKLSVITNAVVKRKRVKKEELHSSVSGKETGLDILGSQEDESFFPVDTKK